MTMRPVYVFHNLWVDTLVLVFVFKQAMPQQVLFILIWISDINLECITIRSSRFT